jgi:hypothetical protein
VAAELAVDKGRQGHIPETHAGAKCRLLYGVAMPIDEYACDERGSVIEVIRRLSDAEPTVHEVRSQSRRRLVAARCR